MQSLGAHGVGPQHADLRARQACKATALPGLRRHPCLQAAPARASRRGRIGVRAAGGADEETTKPMSKNAKVLTLFTAAAVEFAITGGLLWSPMLCALLYILTTPSQDEEEQSRKEEVQRAVQKVRQEMLLRVPATAPESAMWVNCMLMEVWVPFLTPMVLKDNLSAWQDKISSAAPPGWTINLTEMSLGEDAPRMSNYTVFNGVSHAGMAALECDMDFSSDSMKVVVQGSGPLGQFTATVSNFTVKAHMRMLPVPRERMILWSFREPPDARFRVQISGPLVGKQTVPQLSFLKRSFTDAIKDSLVEPRRAAISMDYDYTVQQAIDTTVNIYVESVQNLNPALALADQKGSRNKGMVKGVTSSLASSLRQASGTGKGAAGASGSGVSAGVQRTGGGDRAGSRGWGPGSGGLGGMGMAGLGQGGGGVASVDVILEPDLESDDPDEPLFSEDSGDLETAGADGFSDDGGPGGVGTGRSGGGRGPLGAVAAAAGARGVEGTGFGPSTSSSSSTIGQSRGRVGAPVGGSGGAAGGVGTGQYVVVATNIGTLLQRSTKPHPLANGRPVAIQVQEALKLGLGHKEGIIKLEVQDSSRSGRVLGFCMLHVASSKDGCTLFWALGRNNSPLALRWQPGLGPWKVTIPLEGCPFCPRASITLQLSTDPWLYQQEQNTRWPLGMHRTPGPRTLVVQVLEARHLAAKDWAGTCDPYVQLQYNGRSYRTSTVYNSVRPVWNRTFVVPENASQLTRRIRLDVWDSGVSHDEMLGHVSVNLDMALESAIQDRWLQLAGEESGELRLRLAVVPGPPDSPAVTQMVALFAQTLHKASTATLQVLVLSARNLTPRPASLALGLRDAYCSITFAGARQVTPVAKQSQSPTWNFSALFPLDLSSQRDRRQHAAAPGSSEQTDKQAQHAGNHDGSPVSTVSDAVGASSVSSSGNAAGAGAGNGAAVTFSPSFSTSFPSPSTFIAGAGTGAGKGRTVSRLQPSPSLLRLELRDMDLIPPDDDLGYAMLDVGAIVPEPGMVWEQWLTLRRGRGAELLIRVSHLEPSPIAPGTLPLTQDVLAAQQVAANRSGIHTPSGAGAEGGAGLVTVVPWPGVGSGAEGGFTVVPRLQPVQLDKVLLENFTEQVSRANDRAQEAARYSDELRVRFSQDFIPKVQDWWVGMSSRVFGTRSATHRVRDSQDPEQTMSSVTASMDLSKGGGAAEAGAKDGTEPAASSASTFSRVDGGKGAGAEGKGDGRPPWAVPGTGGFELFGLRRAFYDAFLAGGAAKQPGNEAKGEAGGDGGTDATQAKEGKGAAAGGLAGWRATPEQEVHEDPLAEVLGEGSSAIEQPSASGRVHRWGQEQDEQQHDTSGSSGRGSSSHGSDGTGVQGEKNGSTPRLRPSALEDGVGATGAGLGSHTSVSQYDTIAAYVSANATLVQRDPKGKSSPATSAGGPASPSTEVEGSAPQMSIWFPADASWEEMVSSPTWIEPQGRSDGKGSISGSGGSGGGVAAGAGDHGSASASEAQTPGQPDQPKPLV